MKDYAQRTVRESVRAAIYVTGSCLNKTQNQGSRIRRPATSRTALSKGRRRLRFADFRVQDSVGAASAAPADRRENPIRLRATVKKFRLHGTCPIAASHGPKRRTSRKVPQALANGWQENVVDQILWRLRWELFSASRLPMHHPDVALVTTGPKRRAHRPPCAAFDQRFRHQCIYWQVGASRMGHPKGSNALFHGDWPFSVRAAISKMNCLN